MIRGAAAGIPWPGVQEDIMLIYNYFIAITNFDYIPNTVVKAFCYQAISMWRSIYYFALSGCSIDSVSNSISLNLLNEMLQAYSSFLTLY